VIYRLHRPSIRRGTESRHQQNHRKSARRLCCHHSLAKDRHGAGGAHGPKGKSRNGVYEFFLRLHVVPASLFRLSICMIWTENGETSRKTRQMLSRESFAIRACTWHPGHSKRSGRVPPFGPDAVNSAAAFSPILRQRYCTDDVPHQSYLPAGSHTYMCHSLMVATETQRKESFDEHANCARMNEHGRYVSPTMNPKSSALRQIRLSLNGPTRGFG
jgi:hypothetical protein